ISRKERVQAKFVTIGRVITCELVYFGVDKKTMPAWRNGYAAACRAAYSGSIPGTGSHFSLLTP
ncbi:MAG TPA: hypothetical protein VF393_05560, partial [archaeon]